LVHAPFSALADVAPEPLSGVLFDLGVSSPQLDQAERGFSFRADAPIDMRMDQSLGGTAGDLVNELPEAALTELFRQNGEGRLSGRIARAVVRARPLTSTLELADVVAAAVPAAVRRKGHPAKRVFQALRIAVNDELGELEAALPVALDRLAVGGRCAVISYHSGEDRLTKQIFSRAVTGGCTCPPSLPCMCGAVARHELVFRGARRPTPEELARNPRAGSARLRVIARTAA
jgi:16S rRNA (cytosine1402-N4)-methyltransferase